MGQPSIRVVTAGFPPATGWDTVTLQARLLARCLSAELVTVPHEGVHTRARQALSRLPRRRGADVTIVVAPQPVHLYAAASASTWWSTDLLVGWVIDSFWTDRIPVAMAGRYDHLFLTDGELLGEWHDLTGVPTSWLPFGTDALSIATVSADRPVDLQRIGRQPQGWEDDEANAALLIGAGLSYAGRPPFPADAQANQRGLLEAMGLAKFTLSFSNVHSPAGYTHPTREYLTGRWTDALAMGAVVAGIPPRCAAADRLLWPEATLALPSVDPGEAISVLRDAVGQWRPERARWNHGQALARLDWRWRFAELTQELGVAAPVLDAELDRLHAAVATRS